jgi:hypothetical protein
MRMSASSLVAEAVWKDIESTRAGWFFFVCFSTSKQISTLVQANDFSLDFFFGGGIIYAAI